MDSGNVAYMPNYNYDCNNCSTQEAANAKFDPMQMSDARSAAEQAVAPSVAAMAEAGIDVSSPQAQAAIAELTSQISDTILNLAQQNILKSGEDEESGSTAGGVEAGATSGGSIFKALAEAFGKTMVNLTNELIAAGEQVQNAGDASVLQASTLVTALSQELNVVAQSFNSSINSLGQAASTAARKQ